MTWLLYSEKDLVAQWVSVQLKGLNVDKSYAIGVMIDNQIIAGIVYHNYTQDYKNRPLSIDMSIASIDKRWCSRYNLEELFAYPFTYLGVKRVTATCARKDKSTRRFLSRLGFRLEGIGRNAHYTGGDCASYGLLKKDSKYGKKGWIGPSSTGSLRNSTGAITSESGNRFVEYVPQSDQSIHAVWQH